MDENDIRLYVSHPSADSIQYLVRTPTPVSFVVAVEIIERRGAAVVGSRTSDEVDMVALRFEALPEWPPVGIVVGVTLGNRISERHDADWPGLRCR